MQLELPLHYNNDKAVVIIIEHKGYYLGVSRKKNPSKFGLIGGRVELNESSDQAIIRETLEETGIELFEVHGPIYNSIDKDGFHTYCFYAPQNRSYLHPISPEGLKLEYLSYEEITSTRTEYPVFNKAALDIYIKFFQKDS